MTGKLIKTFKARTGWGKWSLIMVHKCNQCGHETHLRKNWSGPTPPGAFLCNGCLESTISIGGDQ